MKKFIISSLVVIFIFILVFLFYSWTNPMNLLKYFVILSPDGIFQYPQSALFRLCLLFTGITISLTCFIIPESRKKLLKFLKNNIALTVGVTTYLSIYYSTYLFSRKTLYPFLFLEDGVFEYLTVFFWITSSIIFVVFLIKILKANHLPTTLLFLFLAIFAFFVGMEEISWGQRIFGWSTPENFKQINYQNETTLHNLVYQYEIFVAAYLIVSIAFIAFFASANLPEKYVFKIDKSYLPNKKMYYPTLFLPFLAFVDQELFEVTIAAILFVYALKIFHLLRTKNIPVNRESRAII